MFQNRKKRPTNLNKIQLYSHIFRRGFKAGANWQKEQFNQQKKVMKIIKIPQDQDMNVEVVEHWDKGKLVNTRVLKKKKGTI